MVRSADDPCDTEKKLNFSQPSRHHADLYQGDANVGNRVLISARRDVIHAIGPCCFLLFLHDVHPCEVSLLLARAVWKCPIPVAEGRLEQWRRETGRRECKTLFPLLVVSLAGGTGMRAHNLAQETVTVVFHIFTCMVGEPGSSIAAKYWMEQPFEYWLPRL